MIELDEIVYNSEGLPESKNYRVVIAYSAELKSVCYHAQNKQTGVLEMPFRIVADAQIVLDDLEKFLKDSRKSSRSYRTTGNILSLGNEDEELH